MYLHGFLYQLQKGLVKRKLQFGWAHACRLNTWEAEVRESPVSLKQP